MKKVVRLVPSVDFWGVDEFIAARYAQYEAAKTTVDESKSILIKPDDEVICDYCSADAAADGIVTLVEFGSKAVCDACYQKLYANEPIKYRNLYSDGSLGRITD